MGLFRRHDERLDAVAGQLAALDQRLAEAQAENATLQTRLSAIESRPLPAPVPQPSVEDIATRVRGLLGDPPPAIDPRRIEQLEAGHERLQLRLAELSSVVTNQLSELGGEVDAVEHAVSSRLKDLEAKLAEATTALDGLHPATNGAGPTPPELDELRANQVRIANELARFTIAVREEMAALAPRISPSAKR